MNNFEGNGVPKLVDERWGGRHNFRTNVGWKVQDLTSPDKLVEPFVSSLGDYSWRNRIATTYEAKRTGEKFSSLPGEYTLAPGEISRSGNQVRVTDIVPGDYPMTQPLINHAVGRMFNAGTSVPGLQSFYNPVPKKI